jgi:hypothetical protein
MPREPGPARPHSVVAQPCSADASQPGVTAGRHPASRARPVRFPGRRSSGAATDGAADTQEVDMPPHDEQRVRGHHFSRITRSRPGCPGQFRHVDSPDGHMRRHTRGNRPIPRSIPAVPGARFRRVRLGPCARPRQVRDQPWRIQLSGGSDVTFHDSWRHESVLSWAGRWTFSASLAPLFHPV